MSAHRALAATRKELNGLVAAYARRPARRTRVIHTDLRRAVRRARRWPGQRRAGAPSGSRRSAAGSSAAAEPPPPRSPPAGPRAHSAGEGHPAAVAWRRDQHRRHPCPRPASGSRRETSQTLDRGLASCSCWARVSTPAGSPSPSWPPCSGSAGTVVYRLVATLEQPATSSPAASDGRIRLGLAITRLSARCCRCCARSRCPILRAAGRGGRRHRAPHRRRRRRGARARRGRAVLDRATTWPTGSAPGTRSTAVRPVRRSSRPVARADGFVATGGELQSGAHGLAAPLVGVAGLEASLGIVSTGRAGRRGRRAQGVRRGARRRLAVALTPASAALTRPRPRAVTPASTRPAPAAGSGRGSGSASAITVDARTMPPRRRSGRSPAAGRCWSGPRSGTQVAGAGDGVRLQHLGDRRQVRGDRVVAVPLTDLQGDERGHRRSPSAAGSRCRGRSRVTTPRSPAGPAGPARCRGPPRAAGEHSSTPIRGSLGEQVDRVGVERVECAVVIMVMLSSHPSAQSVQHCCISCPARLGMIATVPPRRSTVRPCTDRAAPDPRRAPTPTSTDDAARPARRRSSTTTSATTRSR